MYEPQYIYEKYFLNLLILLGLNNSGVEFVQERRKKLMGSSVFYILLSLYKKTSISRGLSLVLLNQVFHCFHCLNKTFPTHSLILQELFLSNMRCQFIKLTHMSNIEKNLSH